MNDTIKNYMTGGSEDKVNDVLTRLDFISTLKSGERFNPKSLEIRDGSYVSMLMGMLGYEGDKWASYNFINETINEGIEQYYMYRTYSQSFYKNISNELYSSLKRCEAGIRSQMDTYKGCRKLVSKYSTLIKLMKAKIDIAVKSGDELNESY